MWKSFLFFLVILFGFMIPLSAQDSSSAPIHFNTVASPIEFTFDGNYSILTTPLIFGLAKEVPLFGVDIEPGLYISLSSQGGEDIADLVSVGIVPHVTVLGEFGIGFFYKFWETAIGLVEADSGNTGFIISYDINL